MKAALGRVRRGSLATSLLLTVVVACGTSDRNPGISAKPSPSTVGVRDLITGTGSTGTSSSAASAVTQFTDIDATRFRSLTCYYANPYGIHWAWVCTLVIDDANCNPMSIIFSAGLISEADDTYAKSHPAPADAYTSRSWSNYAQAQAAMGILASNTMGNEYQRSTTVFYLGMLGTPLLGRPCVTVADRILKQLDGITDQTVPPTPPGANACDMPKDAGGDGAVRTGAPCQFCPGGIAAGWRFAVSGVTDGTDCTGCSVVNATWNLPQLSSYACGYQATLSTCGAQPANWLLSANGAGEWSLGFTDRVGGSIPTYMLPSGTSFNCLGPNTFVALGQAPGFSCTNFPASLTLSPAP